MHRPEQVAPKTKKAPAANRGALITCFKLARHEQIQIIKSLAYYGNPRGMSIGKYLLDEHNDTKEIENCDLINLAVIETLAHDGVKGTQVVQNDNRIDPLRLSN